jgi:2-haloacid dehalogenase
MAKLLETVVFDLGGVLIDWDPEYVYRSIFPDADKRQWFFDNVCTHDWNARQDAGRSLEVATEKKVLEFPEYEKEIRAFYGRWEEMLGGPVHGTVTLLENLKRNNEVRLLALTNWSHETFPIALERYAFLKWFEGIVVSGHEKTIKPHVAIYQTLLTRYSVEPRKAVFIDDNAENVAGARAAGMQGIHYKSPEALEVSLRALGVDTA